MNRFLYAVHKWISAAAFAQLAIWTVTGFLFVCFSQESMKSAPVEGAHRVAITQAPVLGIARALEIAADKAGAIEKVELRGTPSGLYYFVKGESAVLRIDARSGEIAPVGPEEAVATARRDQPGAPEVRELTRLTEAPPIEYRDCPLPAYRVALADAEGTVVYVDATTGDVSARRNENWRTVDFLWSLHIMDYKKRESYNHVLILGAAVLAMATVLSGTVLLAIRAVRWIRRRAAPRERVATS